ncbi:hypothetical protein OG365_35805 [Streptomyces sp. NBC_00853]|nr:hypothetical protein OG365_35805 [Streptomyces sp. NBC_00853]
MPSEHIPSDAPDPAHAPDLDLDPGSGSGSGPRVERRSLLR